MPFQRWDHSRKSTRWSKAFRSQSSQFIQIFTATVGMWCHPIDSPESSGYYMPNPSWNLGIRVELSPLISLYLCLCDVSHHHTLHSSRWQASGGEAAILPCLIIVKHFPAALPLPWRRPPELPVQLCPGFLFVCLFGIPQETTLYPRTVSALHISPQQLQYTFPGMGCDLNKNLHHWGKGQKSTGRCSLAYACYLRNAVFYQDEQHHLCKTKEVSPLVLSAGP